MEVRYVFRPTDFTFAGKSASEFGLTVCDIGNNKHSDNSFGNSANIVESRIANRITPLHYGVRYHDEPLTFNIIFASEERLDRYQIQEISFWLTGYQDYQWLLIEQPDLENVEYKCLVKSLTPISVGWFPMAFEATFVCDCPYAYGFPFEEAISVTNQREYTFANYSTIHELFKPNLEIVVSSGCREFFITNRSTGKTMKFTNLPGDGVTIQIDNENCILQEPNKQYNLYDYFNFQFFELISGDNDLLIVGTGIVTISGQFLYNTGA